MGTPQFMSPEQLQGNEIDARTDVWSFGVMLYRAASGVAPFKGESFAELTGKILMDDFDKPSAAAKDAGILPELDALVMKCLEREVDRRFASMADVLAAFDKVKAAYGFDDDGVLTAVKADAGALTEPLPVMKSEPTRASLAGSNPAYQGVGTPKHDAPKARSKTPMIAGAAIVVVALGVGAYAMKGFELRQAGDAGDARACDCADDDGRHAYEGRDSGR